MKAVLVLGSNVGDRERSILDAIEFLIGKGEIESLSTLYETPDCLGSGMKYMNAVIGFDTPLEESAFNIMLKEYETSCGRDVERRMKGEVPIDIDIVIWGREIRRPEDYRANYFQEGYRQLRLERQEIL